MAGCITSSASCPGSSSPFWISSSGPAMLPTPPIGTSGNPASDSASSDTWSCRAGGTLPNSLLMLILLHDSMVMILWIRLGTKEASDRSSELSGVFSSKTAQPLASCLSVVRNWTSKCVKGTVQSRRQSCYAWHTRLMSLSETDHSTQATDQKFRGPRQKAHDHHTPSRWKSFQSRADCCGSSA